jgi:PAS domain S-box-containing protein
MEDALHASEEKYRQLHESIRDGFGSVAMDGRLLEFNKTYQDMLGYEKEELLKLKYTDLTPEKWRAFESDIITKQVLPRGYSDVYEKEYRRKDGTILPVELRTVLLKDNEGKNIAMWAIVRDITERKHAEERLRAASVYARSLIESSLDPLVTISADGKITDANKATEDVTGRSRGDLIGSDFSYYFTEPKKAREGYELVFSKGFVKDYPLVIRHKSGRVTDVLYNAAIYRNEAGETQGVFATAKDVTELNLALENLKRSNLELEQFAYVASHDLQEPLRMVTSYMQLLERRYKGKLDADADEFIAYAVDGASHMQGLINDLLAYSRVSSQGKPFEPTDCDSVIDAVLKTLQMSIEESGAVVTHDKLPMVMADETQLFTLFQNLISNAVKFHGKKPPRIHVSAKPQGEEFLFSVRDNGIGIAPEYFDRLFKIFQRLHTKEEYPGTGIGLAVCKRIIERHSGQIWLESQVGKGTTFYFTLNNKKGEKREK